MTVQVMFSPLRSGLTEFLLSMWSTGSTPRTRHAVVPTAVISYRKRTQPNQQRERLMVGEIVETRHSPPEVLSPWRHMGNNPPARTRTTKVRGYLPGRLIRDSMPKGLTGGWSRRHPLIGTYIHSRLPEGSQVLSINSMACTL